VGLHATRKDGPLQAVHCGLGCTRSASHTRQWCRAAAAHLEGAPLQAAAEDDDGGERPAAVEAEVAADRGEQPLLLLRAAEPRACMCERECVGGGGGGGGGGGRAAGGGGGGRVGLPLIEVSSRSSSCAQPNHVRACVSGSVCVWAGVGVGGGRVAAHRGEQPLLLLRAAEPRARMCVRVCVCMGGGGSGGEAVGLPLMDLSRRVGGVGRDGGGGEQGREGEGGGGRDARRPAVATVGEQPLLLLRAAEPCWWVGWVGGGGEGGRSV
jgi:hypothetical protein